MLESKTIVMSADINEIQVSAQPAVRSLHDDVLAEEVLQAFKVVDKNQSFQSADGDNERLAWQCHEVLVRIFEQFANIKTYFLNELPKTGAK